MLCRAFFATLQCPSVEVVRVLFSDDRALLFRQFGAARSIWQDRMLDDVLRDSFHQRVIADCLYEDRPIVVPRRGGHVHLKGEAQVLL